MQTAVTEDQRERIVSPAVKSPDDWLTVSEMAVELRCSHEHVRVLLGKRGGPVQIPWFMHARTIYAERRNVDIYKRNVVTNGTVLRGSGAGVCK